MGNVFALNFPPSEIGQGVKDTCLWHSLSGEATSVSQFPVSKATRRASLRVEKFWPQASQVGGHTTAHGLNSTLNTVTEVLLRCSVVAFFSVRRHCKCNQLCLAVAVNADTLVVHALGLGLATMHRHNAAT